MILFPPVHGQDGLGSGVQETAYGVWGDSDDDSGVIGSSDTGDGVTGISNKGSGVKGTSQAQPGVWGFSVNYYGVTGGSFESTGVAGFSALSGQVLIEGNKEGGIGVYGENTETLGIGVRGKATDGVGVSGQADSGTGITGSSVNGTGVSGSSNAETGVFGGSGTSFGVQGQSVSGFGVSGLGGNVGMYAHNSTIHTGNDAYLGAQGFAGDFHGPVSVLGHLYKFGGGFQIDHPLEPAEKYLSHSFVESADMKNIYDGIAVLDANGEALVELAAWFESLNNDFRYQLTSIGAPGPNLYIAEEISNNRFKIAGGTSGMKVSWQVTGIRQDVWAKAYRIPVEEEKPAKERGYYLHPELHNEPEEKHIRRVRYPK